MDELARAKYTKQANLDKLLTILVKIKKKGYRVDFMNGFTQIRVNGRVDLYPSTKRFRDIKTKRCGRYALDFKSVERIILWQQS